ncbi:hypothetical protein CRG98_034684 [Punica granatum]|uniref:Uncharacterized protein n=1 Tax=Punica granatum TaxID=22663 RepID=A0A2I0ILP1_PUNGR|nr:hypothetical protein CRG98_034684 [Punica granatum]
MERLLDDCIICSLGVLICPRLVLPLGRLLVRWGCPIRVTSDLSSWVERLPAPRDRRPESAVVLAFTIPMILISLFRVAWRAFALAMLTGSCFRRPRCKASRVPVGHAPAYRDVLNDALAASSVIQHARWFRTFLVRLVPRVFVENSSNLHCEAALVCLTLFRKGRPFMEIWLMDIPKSSFMLLVLANFTNDFPYRLKRKTKFAPRVYAAHSDASIFGFIGGTSLLKYRKKDLIGILGGVNPCIALRCDRRVPMKDDEEDDALSDYAVEYTIRNVRLAHEKILFVQPAMHVGDTLFREPSHHHAGVGRP